MQPLVHHNLRFLGSSTKSGLAWPWNGNANDFNLFKNSRRITWAYNWESWVPSGFPGNFEYVAMQRTADGIDKLRNNMAGNKARVLLGFNEPDIASQANLTPERAASLWIQYANPITSGIRVGSPEISNGPNGISWMQKFLPLCHGCNIAFISCHWYGPNFDHFKSHMAAVHSAFPNYKIWLTEFALQGSPSAGEQLSFLKQSQSFLDNTDYIERYSWFGAFRGSAGNNLIDNNGGLTALGRQYSQ